MARFNLTRKVTYIEYYTGVKAETFEEAVEKVRDDLIYDYQELEDAEAPKLDSVEYTIQLSEVSNG